MLEQKVTCDNCNRDLTRTTNCEDYRLVLKDENIPTYGGAVTLMAKYPSLPKGATHFCALSCLRQWITEVYR